MYVLLALKPGAQLPENVIFPRDEQVEGSDFEILCFAEDGLDLNARLEEYQHRKPYVFMAKHWADLSDECIGLCRKHLSHAGLNAAFFEDGVLATVIELLEFRRQYGNGQPLDSDSLERKPLCLHCQLPEETHALDSVQCKAYVGPGDVPNHVRPKEAPKGEG